MSNIIKDIKLVSDNRVPENNILFCQSNKLLGRVFINNSQPQEDDADE
ncbi:MAG: hypothetical protein ACOCRK_11970 [bacterium]